MKSKRFARLAAALLAVILLLSLAGCKSADSETGSPAAETPTSSQTTDAPAKKTETTTGKKTETKKQETSSKKETTKKQTSASQTSKKKTTANQTTTRKTTTAPQRRSLVGSTYDMTTDTVRNLLSGTVEFGPGGIQYQNPKDAAISVQVRSRRNPGGGLQLYLVVKNKTGRPIRLNGYSNFAVRDLLGNELFSTNIALNKPVVLDDQEEQLIAVTLPKEWYEIDDLYQLSMEAGLFHSLIALDYDFL